MRHSFARIGVLSEEQDADLFVRRQLERRKDLFFGRIDLQRKSLAFVINETSPGS